MGSGRWSTRDWNTYATANYGTADRSALRTSKAADIRNSAMSEDLDPAKAKAGLREARDSDDNPESTPIIIGSDVTGSMGHLAKEVLVSSETICSELYARRPVTDPQILSAAIGDAFHDRAPLQVSQFEADIRIVEQIRKHYVEGGGGGNFGESYALLWLFAARMVSTDAWEKRGKKGFLFTVGDEPCLGAAGLVSGNFSGVYFPNVAVTRDQAKRFLNLDIERDLSAEEIYDEASQRWEIVHVCVGKKLGSGSAPTYQYKEGVEASFGQILGDRLLWLQDVTALPELIVSTIQVIAGASKEDVASSWSGDTSVVVAEALGALTPATVAAGTGGVARL